MRKAGSIFLILLCMGTIFACAVNQNTPDQVETQEVAQNLLPKEVQETEDEDLISDGVDEQEEEFSLEKQEKENREDFLRQLKHRELIAAYQKNFLIG